MIICLLCLVAWTVARVIGVISEKTDADLGFVMTGLGLVSLTLLRLLAILIGGAIAFAGLAVSFFAHDNASSLAVGSDGNTSPKMALATYSPGIIGVVVGATVIVGALYAKSNHSYQPPFLLSPIDQSGQSELPTPMLSADELPVTPSP